MDAFTRRYLKVIGAVGVVAVAWWLLSLDSTVVELNRTLASDAELSTYPYPFRVLSRKNGVAEMSSPRSSRVAVIQFLTSGSDSVFPALLTKQGQ